MNYDILYTYINAIILEQGKWYMDVIDTLKYNTTDFFSHLKDNLSFQHKGKDNTLYRANLFCLTGQTNKIKKIKKTITKEILERIKLGENFESSYPNKDLLTQYLNTFTHYLLQKSLSPLIFSFEIDGISVLYLFGSTEFYEEPPKEISELLHIWYEREKPILMGKQIMTQSFYFKSLVGRKSIDIIPSHNDDNLYLLLEGNLKVKLD